MKEADPKAANCKSRRRSSIRVLLKLGKGVRGGNGPHWITVDCYSYPPSWRRETQRGCGHTDAPGSTRDSLKPNGQPESTDTHAHSVVLIFTRSRCAMVDMVTSSLLSPQIPQ